MRGDLRDFRVSRPRKMDDALALLAVEDDRPLPIAGGTDLYVGLNDGKPRAEHYLDLSLLKDLRGIVRTKAGIRLGARTTYTELRRSKDIRRAAPVLQDVARDVGAIAIQNRGTLGGSLGNASPASDPAPVLLVLDAHVELASESSGVRALPLSEFFLSYRKTAARPDELITAVLLPASSTKGWTTWYRKVGTRRAQAISKVVVAGAFKLKKGRVEGARIALGSVAATSLRARAVEAELLGEKLDAALIVKAQDALSSDITPIDDVRSTGAYRMQVARNLLAAMLTAVGGRK